MTNLDIIANKAGVSKATVSNVIHGKGSFSLDTERLVRRIAKDNGIDLQTIRLRKGRPSGKKNRAKRNNNYCLLVHSIYPSMLNTPIYASIINGLESACMQLDKTFSMFHIRDLSKLKNYFKSSRADGYVLFGDFGSDQLADVLRHKNCVELLQPSFDELIWNTVDYNRPRVSQLAAYYLKEQGCKRVFYIGHKDDKPNHGRLFNFLNYYKGENIQAEVISEDQWFIKTETEHLIKYSTVESAFKQFIRVAKEGDGIFFESDLIATSFISCGYRNGYLVDEKHSIISCNNEISLYTGMPVIPATIDLRPSEIASIAIQLLDSSIMSSIVQPTKTVVQPSIVPPRELSKL